MFPIFILFLSAMVLASNESQQSSYIPGAYLNSCIIVDSDHEIAIGPPAERRIAFKDDDRQWWLIIAYALDVVLIFVLAFVFRMQLMRKKKGDNSSTSSGENDIRLASHIPMINLTKPDRSKSTIEMTI